MIKYTDLPMLFFMALLIGAVTINFILEFGWEVGLIYLLLIILLFTFMPMYMEWAERKDMEREKRKEAKG